MPRSPKDWGRSVEAADLEGVRVLVVDDVEMNRRVLAEQLASWGMRPEGVASGVEGIDRLSTEAEGDDPFGIAILDYQMPEIDGVETARLMKKDPALSGTKLVLLTSTARRGDGRRAEDVGFAGYLVKPARPDALRILQAGFVVSYSGHRRANEQLTLETIGGAPEHLYRERVPP